MPDYFLVPVDYQPDFSDFSLVPVNYDPFSLGGMFQQGPSQPEIQPASGVRVAGAANDNLTPQEICDHARAMSNATIRMTAPAGEAQRMMKDGEEAYDLCTTKATRGVFSKDADTIHFPGGGTVIFRPEYQLYVPSPNEPPNFLKPD